MLKCFIERTANHTTTSLWTSVFEKFPYWKSFYSTMSVFCLLDVHLIWVRTFQMIEVPLICLRVSSALFSSSLTGSDEILSVLLFSLTAPCFTGIKNLMADLQNAVMTTVMCLLSSLSCWLNSFSLLLSLTKVNTVSQTPKFLYKCVANICYSWLMSAWVSLHMVILANLCHS